VDVSIDEHLTDAIELGKRVNLCLDRAFADMGLVVIDFKFAPVPARISADIESFWGGYNCEFKLVKKLTFDRNKDAPGELRKLAEPLGTTGSPTFQIDFSRHEFCEDKERFEIDGYTVYGYSPRMFIAEKLRAICQQMPEYNEVVHRGRPGASRARDFIDIQVIAEHYGIDFRDPEFQQIVLKTFAAKKVPISWLGKIENTREQHEPDFQSVRDTVVASYRQRLQEFDFYFRFVCDRCEELKALWNK
jgi:hypothetical protein